MKTPPVVPTNEMIAWLRALDAQILSEPYDAPDPRPFQSYTACDVLRPLTQEEWNELVRIAPAFVVELCAPMPGACFAMFFYVPSSLSPEEAGGLTVAVSKPERVCRIRAGHLPNAEDRTLGRAWDLMKPLSDTPENLLKLKACGLKAPPVRLPPYHHSLRLRSSV